MTKNEVWATEKWLKVQQGSPTRASKTKRRQLKYLSEIALSQSGYLHLSLRSSIIRWLKEKEAKYIIDSHKAAAKRKVRLSTIGVLYIT